MKKNRSEYYKKWYESVGREWSAKYYRDNFNPNAREFQAREKMKGLTCKIDGCNKEAKAQYLCENHYIRMLKYGSPTAPFRRRKNGDGSLRPDGYKIITESGNRIMEHRSLMEKALGRKLTNVEVIHHKDGNRLNNSIENLEVLTNAVHVTMHLKKRVPENSETHRHCPACNLLLPRSDFYKSKYSSDGLRGYCKSCDRERNRKRRVSISNSHSNSSRF